MTALHMINVISKVTEITSFDMKSVATLYTKFRANNFGITDNLMSCIAAGFYPRAAILNHSCEPNCILRYNGSILQIILVKDVLKNEELTHCYIDRTITIKQRKSLLLENYGFQCDCQSCIYNYNNSIIDSNLFELIKTNYQNPIELNQILETIRSSSQQSNHMFGLAEKLQSEILVSSEEYSEISLQINEIIKSSQHSSLIEQNDQLSVIQLEEAYDLLKPLVGSFNYELYQLKTQLLTTYLITNEFLKAFTICKEIICYLLLSLHSFSCHPLIGLQLFTLGPSISFIRSFNFNFLS